MRLTGVAVASGGGEMVQGPLIATTGTEDEGLWDRGVRLPASHVPPAVRDRLIRQWAAEHCLSVPQKPQTCLLVAGVAGLFLAVLPGLLALALYSQQERDYKRRMESLAFQWARDWQAARQEEILRFGDPDLRQPEKERSRPRRPSLPPDWYEFH
jgi:hypothetical protein